MFRTKSTAAIWQDVAPVGRAPCVAGGTRNRKTYGRAVAREFWRAHTRVRPSTVLKERYFACGGRGLRAGCSQSPSACAHGRIAAPFLVARGASGQRSAPDSPTMCGWRDGSASLRRSRHARAVGAGGGAKVVVARSSGDDMLVLAECICVPRGAASEARQRPMRDDALVSGRDIAGPVQSCWSRASRRLCRRRALVKTCPSCANVGCTWRRACPVPT